MLTHILRTQHIAQLLRTALRALGRGRHVGCGLRSCKTCQPQRMHDRVAPRTSRPHAAGAREHSAGNGGQHGEQRERAAAAKVEWLPSPAWTSAGLAGAWQFAFKWTNHTFSLSSVPTNHILRAMATRIFFEGWPAVATSLLVTCCPAPPAIMLARTALRAIRGLRAFSSRPGVCTHTALPSPPLITPNPGLRACSGGRPPAAARALHEPGASPMLCIFLACTAAHVLMLWRSRRGRRRWMWAPTASSSVTS